MKPNPYAPPQAEVADVAGPYSTRVSYAGFWVRVAAALIDGALIFSISVPLSFAVYGWAYFDGSQSGLVAGPADVVISWVLPAVASIAFWMTKQATPGKMVVSARVVDAKTGDTVSLGQSVTRYLGYFIAVLPLGVGLIWIAFDSRKQGWHDKLAGTIVVRAKGPRRNALLPDSV